MQEDDAHKLRFELYRNLANLAVATLGGAITLLQTVFKGEPDKTCAYVSIALLICAALMAFCAQEAIANRASGSLKFRNRFFSFLFTPRFISLESEYASTNLCQISFILALIFFAYFVVGA